MRKWYSHLFILLTSIGAQILKDKYGFDFVSFVPGSGKKWNPTKGWKNCLKGEYSRFARKCRKRGGVFKCCFSGQVKMTFYHDDLLIHLATGKDWINTELSVKH